MMYVQQKYVSKDNMNQNEIENEMKQNKTKHDMKYNMK